MAWLPSRPDYLNVERPICPKCDRIVRHLANYPRGHIVLYCEHIECSWQIEENLNEASTPLLVQRLLTWTVDKGDRKMPEYERAYYFIVINILRERGIMSDHHLADPWLAEIEAL